MKFRWGGGCDFRNREPSSWDMTKKETRKQERNQMNPKSRRKARLRAAARAPEWVRRPAAQKGGNRTSRFETGSHGAASDVRRIDPSTGNVISVEAARAPNSPGPIRKPRRRARRPSNAITISDGGPPCPRCGADTLIRVHGPKWRQPTDRFFYLKWYKCVSIGCPTTEIMPPEYRVYPPGLGQ